MRRVGLEPTSPCGQRPFETAPVAVCSTAAGRSILPLGRTGIASSRPASLEAMCGRYTLTEPDPARIRARFGLDESAELEEEPRYNIAPTDPVLAIRRTEAGAREPGRLRWGWFPGRWAERRSGPPLINARAETLRQPAGLRRVVPRAPLPDPRRRLLRVAQGRGRQDADLGQPARRRAVRVRRASGPALPARDESPGYLHSCAIVTCAAERADPPDPRPDAGDPAARARGAAGSTPSLGEEELLALLVPGAGGRPRHARGRRLRQRRRATTART